MASSHRSQVSVPDIRPRSDSNQCVAKLLQAALAQDVASSCSAARLWRRTAWLAEHFGWRYCQVEKIRADWVDEKQRAQLSRICLISSAMLSGSTTDSA